MERVSSFRLVTQIPDSKHSGGFDLVLRFDGKEFPLSADFDAGSSLVNDLSITEVDVSGFEALLQGAKVYSNKKDTWRCARINVGGWTSDGRSFFAAVDVDPNQDRNANRPGDNDSPVNLNGLSPLEWGWATWMCDHQSILGNKTLAQICIPGAHDAGMSAFNKHKGAPIVGGVNRGNTITQTQPIYDLLSLGVRFFDLRPVINADGSFSTGHFSKVEVLGTVGANGVSFDEVINDINRFTSQTRELIILSISHYRSPWGPTFDNKALAKLIAQMQRINGLFAAPASPTNLQDITINSYLASGAAVLVLLANFDDQDLPTPLPAGFYSTMKRFPISDSYTDTNQLDDMMKDQIAKLKNPQRGYFLMSWTLSWKLGGLSILNLANHANANLGEITKACSRGVYPNIVYLDKVQSPDAASLAMQINSNFIS